MAAGNAYRACGPAGRRAERQRFPHRGMPRPDAGAGRDAAAHAVAVARSLHARAHERRAVLRHAGRHRRGDGGRHGQRGRGLEQSTASPRATSCSAPTGWQTHALSDGTGSAQARSGAGAGLDRARRARHAGHDRLHGPARDRAAARRRDGGGVGRLRRGRLGGRPDRQDQGRARRRHRRRAGQVPLRRWTSSASTPASITRAPICRRGSRRPARRASTSISRTSAARCSRRCFRC